MAKTVTLKIPDDIEFRVIGNAFGLLIASAGLLAGTMLRERSLDYWLEDIVPLVITLWLGFRLFRNLLLTWTAYRDIPPRPETVPAPTTVNPEQVIMGQIADKNVPSPEQVVEEVAKRIDAKRAEAERRNKFTN